MIVVRCTHWQRADNEAPLIAADASLGEQRGPGVLVPDTDLLVLLCEACTGRGEATIRLSRRPDFAP